MGVMHSFVESELRRTAQGLFSYSMALSDGRACKQYFYGNPEKNYRCALQAKSWRMNGIQAHSWYSSQPNTNGWYIACYTVHIKCLSGLNSTLQYHRHVKKQHLKKWDRGLGLQYQTKYRSVIIGELLVLSSFPKVRSR